MHMCCGFVLGRATSASACGKFGRDVRERGRVSACGLHVRRKGEGSAITAGLKSRSPRFCLTAQATDSACRAAAAASRCSLWSSAVRFMLRSCAMRGPLVGQSVLAADQLLVYAAPLRENRTVTLWAAFPSCVSVLRRAALCCALSQGALGAVGRIVGSRWRLTLLVSFDIGMRPQFALGLIAACCCHWFCGS